MHAILIHEVFFYKKTKIRESTNWQRSDLLTREIECDYLRIDRNFNKRQRDLEWISRDRAMDLWITVVEQVFMIDTTIVGWRHIARWLYRLNRKDRGAFRAFDSLMDILGRDVTTDDRGRSVGTDKPVLFAGVQQQAICAWPRSKENVNESGRKLREMANSARYMPFLFGAETGRRNWFPPPPLWCTCVGFYCSKIAISTVPSFASVLSHG